VTKGSADDSSSCQRPRMPHPTPSFGVGWDVCSSRRVPPGPDATSPKADLRHFQFSCRNGVAREESASWETKVTTVPKMDGNKVRAFPTAGAPSFSPSFGERMGPEFLILVAGSKRLRPSGPTLSPKDGDEGGAPEFYGEWHENERMGHPPRVPPFPAPFAERVGPRAISRVTVRSSQSS